MTKKIELLENGNDWVTGQALGSMSIGPNGIVKVYTTEDDSKTQITHMHSLQAALNFVDSFSPLNPFI